MCSLILFSLYSNDLLKYKDCVIKTCFQRGFELKISFMKKNFTCREKSGTVTKVKLVSKIKKSRKLSFIFELWY